MKAYSLIYMYVLWFSDLDSQLTELLQQSTSDWKTDNASDRNNFNQPNKQQKLCIFKTPLKSSME